MFSQLFKNERRYDILLRPDADALEQLTRKQFRQVHDDQWQSEWFHRVIKQVCNIERFYARDEQAIRNHFFCALRAFGKLQTLCIKGVTKTCGVVA